VSAVIQWVHTGLACEDGRAHPLDLSEKQTGTYAVGTADAVDKVAFSPTAAPGHCLP